MIETIIDYLNIQLASTGLMEKMFCLCDLIYSKEGHRPAMYLRAGNLEEINNFTNYNGVSYWRKDGNVSISENDNYKVPAPCDSILTFDIPLKLVCVVPKVKANEDNQYTDDEIALKLFRYLYDNPTVLKNNLNAIDCMINVTGWTTDNNTILSAEYSIPRPTDFDYKFSYISMEVKVVVVIKQSCLVDPCS